MRGGCSPPPGQGSPVLWVVPKRSGGSGEPLPNRNLAQCHNGRVMSDIERICPRGAPQYRDEAAGEVVAIPTVRCFLGARGVVGAVPSRGNGAKDRREQRCFPGAARLLQERGSAVPSPVPRTGLPAPPAVERGVFDNCAIYLANKFADQLIPVTAALPRINYSEFKYNHWLIPTSSGPRLAIHPCE